MDHGRGFKWTPGAEGSDDRAPRQRLVFVGAAGSRPEGAWWAPGVGRTTGRLRSARAPKVKREARAGLDEFLARAEA